VNHVWSHEFGCSEISLSMIIKGSPTHHIIMKHLNDPELTARPDFVKAVNLSKEIEAAFKKYDCKEYFVVFGRKDVDGVGFRASHMLKTSNSDLLSAVVEVLAKTASEED